jgi:superfamily II DNA or RNA helicase
MTPQQVRRIADGVFDKLFFALEDMTPPTRRRGREYVNEGRVYDPVFGPGRISANVDGSLPYHTEWRLDRSGWHPDCTCPIGRQCKHAYALGALVLSLVEDGVGIPSDDLARLLMGLLPDGGAAGPGRDAAPRTPPPPPAPPPDTLQALQESRDPYQRAEILNRLMSAEGLQLESGTHGVLREILEQRDPELLAWTLAHELERWNGGKLPAALELFRDRPDLARRAAVEQRPKIERQLVQWASGRGQRARAQLRVVLSLAPSLDGGWRASVETRLRSARLDDEPRNFDQLRTLHSKLPGDPGLLSGGHTVLLEAILAAHVRSQTGGYWAGGTRRGPIFELLNSILPSPDVFWSDSLPPAAARAGIAAGSAVRFDPTVAQLLPMLQPDGADDDACLGLFALWPDGRRRSHEEVLLLFAGPSIYSEEALHVVSDGVLHPLAETLPTELLKLMARTPVVPLSRKSGTPIVRALASALSADSDSLAALTATHAVSPVVLLALDEYDRLQVRLVAHTPGTEWPAAGALADGARVFEYAVDERWVELAGNAQAAERDAPVEFVPGAAGATGDGVGTGHADAHTAGAAVLAESPHADIEVAETATAARPDPRRAWLHAPEPRCVAPIIEWLRMLGAQPSQVASERERDRRPRSLDGWWVKLTPRTVPRLAEAWQHRPAGVRWLGNRALVELLGHDRLLTPRLSARPSGVDLFAVSAEWEAEGNAVTDADLAKLRAAREPWVKLSGGWARRDTLGVHEQAMDTLADLGIEPGAGEQTLSLWQLAQARPESLEAFERMGADPAAIEAVRALRRRVEGFKGLPRCPLPKGLTAELRPYQREGLDFLAHASSLGMGTVLADDMGLGKTVQALAWLLHLRKGARKPGPALVVCPASVMHNWEREAERFAPGLRVARLASGAGRAEQLRSLSRVDLAITNYALLRRDIEAWQEQELFAVIADEAQTIKNPVAAVSRAMCQLRSPHRLALTGTPLENRALDLWSIVRFVNPGYLGTQNTFVQRFDRADAPPHNRRLLAAKLRPMLLRRLKRDVAPELPDRIEERRDCEMTAGQRKLYLAELARARQEIAMMAAAGGLNQHKIEILAALTRLRQICCHPQLAGGLASLGSGKFEALFDLIEPILAEGHKVLVFSQFVKALELVRAELRRRKLVFHMLTGATTDRERVVAAFEQDAEPCVFLISLRAGGTGLNLTAASYVVLLDPWWNPAVEAQAIDRTHRIGQNRTVIAYRLLMQGTIEEKIWELQQRKTGLVNEVLGEDGFAKALDREALEYLFGEG